MMASLIFLIAAKSMTSGASRIKFNPNPLAPHAGRMMQQGPVISTRLNLDNYTQVSQVPGGFTIWSSNEEEAKGAWLDKLDDPFWGAVAAAVTMGPTGDDDEAIMWTKASRALVDIALREEAKAARPAKMDGPSWDAVAATVLEVALGGTLTRNNKVAFAQRVFTDLAKKHKGSAMDELLGDDYAAKSAWLARMDAPTWDAMAEAVSDVASIVAAPDADDDVDDAAAANAAKKSWLERVDAATWAKAAPAINTIAQEEKAKDAWLEKIVEAIAPVVAVGAGDAGAAGLKGRWKEFKADAVSGEQIFSGNCATCHEAKTGGGGFIPSFNEDDVKNVATYVISMANKDMARWN